MMKFMVEATMPDVGAMVPVKVLDFNPENASVYLKSDDNYMQEGWYSIPDTPLYESPPAVNPEELKQRLAVPSCPVEALYYLKKGEPLAWHRGKVVSENKGLYGIELNLATKRTINQSIDMIRLSHEPTRLTKESLHRLSFLVPDKLIEEAANDHHLTLFAQKGKFDYVRFDPQSKSIVVLVSGDSAALRVNLLFHFHIKHADTRRILREEITVAKAELFGPEVGCYRLEFSVPRENLHDSLGPDCVNLKRARALPGIVRILPREDGLYTVIAKDENSMNEAREILDFVSELIFVEQPLAGHIIGKHATNIENIVKTSHVSKIDVLDTPDMLRNRGIDEWRERCVAFLITGSRADTDAAKMLIEYQLDHNRQMEAQLFSRRPLPERNQRRGDFSHQQSVGADSTGNGENKPPESRLVAPTTGVDEQNSEVPERRADGPSSRNVAPSNSIDTSNNSDKTAEVSRSNAAVTEQPSARQDNRGRRQSAPNDKGQENGTHFSYPRGDRGGYRGRGRGRGGNYQNGPNQYSEPSQRRDSRDGNTSTNINKANRPYDESNPRQQSYGGGDVDNEGYQRVRTQKGRGSKRGGNGPSSGPSDVPPPAGDRRQE